MSLSRRDGGLKTRLRPTTVLAAARHLGPLAFVFLLSFTAAAQGLATPPGSQGGSGSGGSPGAGAPPSGPALPGMTPVPGAPGAEIPEGLRDKALTITIKATVPGPSETVAWQADSVRDTIPGTPVGVKLVGTNVAILLQLTPYDDGKGGLVLVAQGQVWVKKPTGEFAYFTSLDTVAVRYGELVYFFPLGRPPKGDAPMRVEVKILRYGEARKAGSGQESGRP